MNISLRKASALQNSIIEAIRGIEIKTMIDINEFEDPSFVLEEANSQLIANDERRQKLLLAFYNIRGLVGTANTQSGIDVNLAKSAFIDKRISQLEDLATAKPVQELPVILGKLAKIRDRKEDRLYGRDDSVTTSVISQDQINQAKTEIKNLKKQKQKLNDEILELNIKTEIPLSEDVVNTLQAEGLL
jgi:uncharacterized protein YdcH (DUF465 family)